jgi:hypothetical protein
VTREVSGAGQEADTAAIYEHNFRKPSETRMTRLNGTATIQVKMSDRNPSVQYPQAVCAWSIFSNSGCLPRVSSCVTMTRSSESSSLSVAA